MVTTRVSTSHIFDTSISNIGTLRSQLATLQQQVSSGERASTFTELGTDIIRFQDIERNVQANNSFITSVVRRAGHSTFVILPTLRCRRCKIP
jgi:flagellin-like hook-associated protein FlgL